MSADELPRLKQGSPDQEKVDLGGEIKAMDAKRVETISARVDAAVSAPGRTVVAWLNA